VALKDRNGVDIQLGDIVSGPVAGRGYDVTGPAVHLPGDLPTLNVGITLGNWGPEGCTWSTEYATSTDLEIVSPASDPMGLLLIGAKNAPPPPSAVEAKPEEAQG